MVRSALAERESTRSGHSRRQFLKTWALGLPALGIARGVGAQSAAPPERPKPVPRRPLVVSTWQHGLAANAAAWMVLAQQGRALDAVEAGVRVSEADPAVNSVGLGGLPDRDGRVTLDACIMDERGRCGAVAFLQHIVHPTSVARLVMERTPHVFLVGEGALQFALANGFRKEKLLTREAEAAWRQWRETQAAPARAHDTIGMLAIDAEGRLSGACTTSGLAYKMHGRVGDSPLIGAGLYVDNDVGGACATGLGEAVIATAGSFLIVELMRRGATPLEACREAVSRIVTQQWRSQDLQVGFLALSRLGEVGTFSLRPGFSFALHDASGNAMHDAASWFDGSKG